MVFFQCHYVSAFFIAYFTGYGLLDLHVYAAYLITGLLVFRLIRDFVGSYHACFSDFVKPSGEVWICVKSIIGRYPRCYPGHNLAGGAVVMVLLLSLVLVTIGGIVLYTGSKNLLAASLSGIGEFWERCGGRDA